MKTSYLEPKDLINSTFDVVSNAYQEYMLLKNFSQATISAYLSNFRRYNQWCTQNDIDRIYHQDHVKAYLIYRVRNGAKWQTMNNIYSAMRKLFRDVLDLEWSYKKMPRPKKERHLPELISKQEIAGLIDNCKMLKHKVILITLYATGVRSAELCQIKLSDIDSNRNQIRIVKGKGSKDRYVNIPPELIIILRHYYRVYKPAIYLFNGRVKGSMMSVSSLRWPIREARKRLKLIKKVSPHTFRHCYATHHLEGGTDLVFLQKNLGHKHLRTTIRYIHLCNQRYQHIHHPLADIVHHLFPKIMG